MSTNIFENSFLPNIFVQNPAFGCNYTRTTSSLDSDEKEQNTFISIIYISISKKAKEWQPRYELNILPLDTKTWRHEKLIS